MTTPWGLVSVFFLLLNVMAEITGEEQRQGLLAKAFTNLPLNATGNPDGYWFGTQNLFCVMGVTGVPSSSGRRKRRGAAITASSIRYPLKFAHRLIFYRDTIFEWGTGSLGYYVGSSPSVMECPVIWESMPAGESRCPREALRRFTYSYRARHGVYNLATNNCHHFANRASLLLASKDCKTQPSKWAGLARRFWRFLGRILTHREGDFSRVKLYNDDYIDTRPSIE